MQLPDAADRLFDLPLAQFVRERDALARELRAAGRRDEAESVAELRKPTLVAWTVNQLARTKRREVDRLLDAGHRLVAAQQAALGGEGRRELDMSRREEQQAIARLVDGAAEILGARAGRETLERVETMLRGAAISGEGRELLARGRFMHETTSTGWDVLQGMTATSSRTGATSSRDALARRQRKAKEALADAKRQVKELERDARDARRELDRLDRARATAEAKLLRVEEALRDAEAALEAAERELERP